MGQTLNEMWVRYNDNFSKILKRLERLKHIDLLNLSYKEINEVIDYINQCELANDLCVSQLREILDAYKLADDQSKFIWEEMNDVIEYYKSNIKTYKILLCLFKPT